MHEIARKCIIDFTLIDLREGRQWKIVEMGVKNGCQEYSPNVLDAFVNRASSGLDCFSIYIYKYIGISKSGA